MEDEIRLLMRRTSLMSTSVSLYHRHRFPTEIISHWVWLYFRFALSFRDGIVRLTAEDVIEGFLAAYSRMRTSVSLYHRHRFPTEIISHCVWLYFRFALNFRWKKC